MLGGAGQPVIACTFVANHRRQQAVPVVIAGGIGASAVLARASGVMAPGPEQEVQAASANRRQWVWDRADRVVVRRSSSDTGFNALF